MGNANSSHRQSRSDLDGAWSQTYPRPRAWLGANPVGDDYYPSFNSDGGGGGGGNHKNPMKSLPIEADYQTGNGKVIDPLQRYNRSVHRIRNLPIQMVTFLTHLHS